ncbi:MAG: glycosyl hydrolase, partial [Leifsonia sp.]
MVDLRAKPFTLDDEAVEWVERTAESLTLEEKIGQLFINLNVSFDEGYLDNVVTNLHVGGIRYMGADSAAVQKHIRYAQSKAKVPLLVASNPEMGGAGSAD